MTDRAHVAAVKALLDASSGLVAFDSEVPPGTTAPLRYAILYCTTPSGTVRRLCQMSPAKKYTVSVLSVGNTPNECRWVAEKVQTALNNVRPVVTGRVCTSLGEPTGSQVRPDPSTAPPAWVVTDVWQFASTPSA